MDKMPLLAVIFYSIPESIIIFCLGLAVIGKKINFYKILPAAVISALITWVVRSLPIPFGVHTLVGLIVISILFFTIFKMNFKDALISTLFVFSLIGAVEALVLPVMLSLADMDIQQLWKNLVLRIVLPIPELIFLAATAYYMVKHDCSLKRIRREYYGDTES